MQGQPAQNGPSYGASSFNQGGPTPGVPGAVPPVAAEKTYSGSPQQQHFPPTSASEPPQLPLPRFASVGYTQPTAPAVNNNGNHSADLPALKPIFGVSLDDLSKRDGSAVPIVVYQCLQAVDLFGLEVEGIYRLSGTASHITKLRAIFDNGESRNEEYAVRRYDELKQRPRLVSGGFQESREFLPRCEQRRRLAQAVLP